MAFLRPGQCVGDLVQYRVGDLIRRPSHGVQSAENDGLSAPDGILLASPVPC